MRGNSIAAGSDAIAVRSDTIADHRDTIADYGDTIADHGDAIADHGSAEVSPYRTGDEAIIGEAPGYRLEMASHFNPPASFV